MGAAVPGADSEPLFVELKRYVGFTDADEARLRMLAPAVAPHFERITDVFYARILQHDGARQALTGGESRVGQLKVTLRQWLAELFQGPWDEGYYERRARIGRVHVRIQLPQHYMFGAMNVLRVELLAVLEAAGALASDRAASLTSLERMLDLELAIMLHTYREDLLRVQARSERLATFGQLVGSIGHELRNPLGVIETSLYVAKGRASDDPKLLKHLDRIGEQTNHANGILSQLLDMIRDRPLVPEPLSLESVVDQALATLSVPREVTVRRVGLDTLPLVLADPTLLRQALRNLLENALHAVGASGTVEVTGRLEGDWVAVRVDDTGPGLAPEVQQQLFEPLVTTKARGIGLGLALVRRIAQRHGGQVTGGRAPSGGARFEFVLPSERRAAT